LSVHECDYIAKGRSTLSKYEAPNPRSLGLALPFGKANTGSTTVLGDKLDTSPLKRGYESLAGFHATANVALGRIEPLYCWR
jgi:hypothetical protein